MTRRLARIPLLVVLLAGGALAQDVALRGEVGLDAGATATVLGGEATTRVPTLVRARLELDVDLGGRASLRGVVLPALGAGADPGAPQTQLGLQEAFARLRLDDADLSVGVERLPLAEGRLVEPVSVEGRLETGEPRGVLGARASAYLGSWRARAALLATEDEDGGLDGVGGVASLRRESAGLTAEAHALLATRPALGATASGSVGDVVVYGEAWLLADPWDGRGGVGATGYAGDWMWTAEAAWAAPEGALRAEGRPVLAGNATRPLGTDASIDATLRLALPPAEADPARRVAVLDAATTLRHDVADASLSVTPALRIDDGAWSGSLGLSVRGYF